MAMLYSDYPISFTSDLEMVTVALPHRPRRGEHAQHHQSQRHPGRWVQSYARKKNSRNWGRKPNLTSQAGDGDTKDLWIWMAKDTLKNCRVLEMGNSNQRGLFFISQN